MALKSVAEQFKGNPEYFLEINKYINMLTNALAMKTQIDEDNFWTKSLVMQVRRFYGFHITVKCRKVLVPLACTVGTVGNSYQMTTPFLISGGQ